MEPIVQFLSTNLLAVLIICLAIIWLTSAALWIDSEKQRSFIDGLIVTPFHALILIPITAALVIAVFLIKTIWLVV